MLPLSSRRSSTLSMSNFAYLASLTPSATFSKSQNSAMLMMSDRAAMLILHCRYYCAGKKFQRRRWRHFTRRGDKCRFAAMASSFRDSDLRFDIELIAFAAAADHGHLCDGSRDQQL